MTKKKPMTASARAHRASVAAAINRRQAMTASARAQRASLAPARGRKKSSKSRTSKPETSVNHPQTTIPDIEQEPIIEQDPTPDPSLGGYSDSRGIVKGQIPIPLSEPSSPGPSGDNLEKSGESKTPCRGQTSTHVPTPVHGDVSGAEEDVNVTPDRVSSLYRMPTPRAHVPDSDEEVAPDKERMMREVLAGKRKIGDDDWSGQSHTLVDDDESVEVTDEEGKNDDKWKLKEGVEGGPQNPELLRGFLAHVAYAIWHNEDRGVLKVVKSYEGLIDRWINDARLLPAVCVHLEKSGLRHLKYMMYKHIDAALISAFVERWQPETNSFHMPLGEVTILLHDLAYLGRINIGGKLAIDKMTQNTLRTKFALLLGVPVQTVKENSKSGCLKFALVEDKLRRGRGPTENVAKVYLMWLLSSTLFTDKTKFGILADLFPFVDELDNVAEYNWGAATLVNLYRQLGVASRKDCVKIAGCLTMLQGWIYAYFPQFRPEEKPGWDEDMPWVSKWGSKFKKPTDEALRGYREALDRLSPHDVEWTPFHERPGEIYPISLFHGVLQFRQIKEPYMHDRALRQFGYMQTIPPSPYVPTVKELRWKPNAYVCEFQITPELYENSHIHSIRFDGTRPVNVNSPGEYADDYIEWFVERTHLWVINPFLPTPTTTDEVTEAEAKLERVVGILQEAHPDVRGEDVELHPYVDLIDRVCAELGDYYAARGIGRAHAKGEGKRTGKGKGKRGRR